MLILLAAPSRPKPRLRDATD